MLIGPKDMAVMKHMKPLIGVIALSLAGGGLSACGGGEHAPDVKAREPIARLSIVQAE